MLRHINELRCDKITFDVAEEIYKKTKNKIAEKKFNKMKNKKMQIQQHINKSDKMICTHCRKTFDNENMLNKHHNNLECLEMPYKQSHNMYVNLTNISGEIKKNYKKYLQRNIDLLNFELKYI